MASENFSHTEKNKTREIASFILIQNLKFLFLIHNSKLLSLA